LAHQHKTRHEPLPIEIFSFRKNQRRRLVNARCHGAPPQTHRTIRLTPWSSQAAAILPPRSHPTAPQPTEHCSTTKTSYNTINTGCWNRNDIANPNRGIMYAVTATPGHYEPHLRQWVPLAQQTHTITAKRLTIATLNVWNVYHHFEQRCQAILDLLAASQPDLIALQEVTPAFHQQILNTPWIQDSYQLSDIYAESVDPYGVLLFSRYPASFELMPLPSAHGRCLHTAQLTINQHTTTFSGVHLESTIDAAPTRAKQLTQIFPQLAAAPHAMLVGDFNFCSSWEENAQLPSAYQDVWAALRPHDPGYTVDTTINTMRLEVMGKPKHVRFDRILLRSQQPGWQAESIELLGTDALEGTSPAVFPSDHFGLISTLIWREN
jgi:tyrosyl-DNA phosphodiesterase 2